jgi:hypothetical protein
MLFYVFQPHIFIHSSCWLQDYDQRAPHRLILVTEYLLVLFCNCLTVACIAAASLPISKAEPLAALAATPLAIRSVPLLMWLWIQWNSWALGHTSAPGRLLGLYCVFEDRLYNEHLQVATVWQVQRIDNLKLFLGKAC